MERKLEEGNTNQEGPGEDKPLWDPSRPDGQDFILTIKLGKKLTKAADNLKDIVISADLWAHLQRYGVMGSADVDRCKRAGCATADQAESIIEFLKMSPVWKFHAFLRSLAKTNQAGWIDVVLGPNRGFPYTRNLMDIGIRKSNTNQESPGEDKPLWDPSHPDGQDFILTNELGEKLTKAADKLKDIVISADLWAHLQRYGVMGSADVDRCKRAGCAEADQAESIIDFLKRSQVWNFHAFLRSLAQTDQAGMIDEILGPNRGFPYSNTNQERPGEDKPLWDPSHPDGQDFMLTNKLGEKLTKAADNLKDIVISADLWAHLQRYGVMGSADVDMCKRAGCAEADQAESIIDFLKMSQVWNFHAFLRSLAQTDQAGMIDVVLGPNGKAPYTRNLMD